MKPIIALLMCVFLFFSCRKMEIKMAESYLECVMASSKDSLSVSDYPALDFTRAVYLSVDSVDLHLVKVPFKNKLADKDFVLVQTNREGKIRQGRIVRLTGGVQAALIGPHQYAGTILIQSLKREDLVVSVVNDGYFIGLNKSANAKNSLVQPANVLPEVVITYTIPSSGKSLNIKLKTDIIDARIISQVGAERHLKEWLPPAEFFGTLKAVTHLYSDLKSQKTQFVNRLHSAGFLFSRRLFYF